MNTRLQRRPVYSQQHHPVPAGGTLPADRRAFGILALTVRGPPLRPLLLCAASYAFSPKLQGISDEKSHYDQANQIEDAIHTLSRKYARRFGPSLVQPAERPHEQENGNGNTQQPQQSCTSHFGLLCIRLPCNG
jgi:hypothetical protein